MKGTQLWQGTRSPLIEGRSRRVGPFWRAWLGALLLGVAIALAIVWAWRGTLPVVPIVVGAVLGSTIGVWGGRVSGIKRSWIPGVVVAVVLAAVVLGGAALWLPQVLSAIGEAV